MNAINPLLTTSIEEIIPSITSGEVSPLSLAEATISRIDARKDINAFVKVDEEHVRHNAKKSCERIRENQSGALEGIPIGVKDIFCTKGIRSTACSKMLENFVPEYESTVTKRILEQGAVIVGKTNMDEFAMGSSNKTSYFGAVRNPWNPEYVSGGSSGGSAAAVADYLCHAALGSDTGGSIRQPAAMCGVVGVKPSYGRCSRFGMIAYSSSLDQAGVLARSVQDSCIVLDHMMGHCVNDSTTMKTLPPKLSEVQPCVRGKKIGYIAPYLDRVDSSVKDQWMRSIDILRDAGAEIVEISFSEVSDGEHDPIQQWTAVYYGFTTVEAFSNYCRYDGIRYGTNVDGDSLDEYYRNTRDQFGSEVKRRMLIGAHILSNADKKNTYERSINYRCFVRSQFDTIFSKLDAILSPTSPHTAFRLDYQKTPIEMYYEDMFTVVANLIGSPAISIPSGLSAQNDLPIGMQVMTKQFNEVAMIEVAKFLENVFQFKKLHEVTR